MCIGGLFSKPKAPALPPPPPVPDPAPVPVPQEENVQLAGEARRQRLDRLRRGIASTIKSRGRQSGGSLTSSSLIGSSTLG